MESTQLDRNVVSLCSERLDVGSVASENGLTLAHRSPANQVLDCPIRWTGRIQARNGLPVMCDDQVMRSPEDLAHFDQIRLRIRGMDVRVFESAVVTGPAFVLIHGFGVSSRYFGPLASELSQYGRVLVLDLPGFGKSNDPDHSLRITGFAQVVNEAIRRLEVIDPVLVGHSMGTQVAVESLIRAPGLARGALLAAPVVNDRERTAGLLMWRFAQSAVKESASSAWDSVRGFLNSGPRWLLRDFGPMLRYRMEDRIQQVDVPLTVVGGRGDRIAPPDWCRRLATIREDSRIVIVDGAAHEMIHTNAPEVARLALELTKSRGTLPQRPSPGLPPCGD